MEALADSVRETRVLSRLGLGLVAIGWVFLLWRATDVFRPDSAFVPTYNSDVAIPLLMADEPQASPFSLYYYGQDRYGAWPFLLAHLLGRVAHFNWSPERLSTWPTLFMFSAAWPLWRLAGKTDFIVPSYLGIFLLNPVVQFNYAPSQPYGWQASTLIWTWWSLRQLSRGRNARFWIVAACLGSILAVWSSPLSGVILVVLATLEWGLARRKSFLTMMIAPAIGIGVEKLLRAWFHQYARLNFHYSYEGPLELDRGHLPQNAAAMWSVLLGRPWWIVQVGVVLAGAFFLVSWAKRALRQTGPSAVPQDTWRVLALGCAAICGLTFAATVAVAHVRYNLYSERYLALVHLFGGIGAVASIMAILPARPISVRARNVLSLALTVLLTMSVALQIPPLTINPAYAELKAGADWLANRPVPIVLGGYWGTYVFAGLAAPKRVIPIPVEEDSQRTPWTGGALHQAEQVVISPYETDRFGPANNPDRWVTDRGEFLERAETPSWNEGVVTFWTYLNATKRALPISTVSVSTWNACGEELLSIDVGNIQSAELVYWAQSPSQTIEVVGQITHGGERVPDAVEHGTRMNRFVFQNGAAISRITLQPKGQRKKCVLEALALFKR
jgi:hypothetical protein